MKKIDALADISPEKVIEMYAEKFPKMPVDNRAEAITYLRHYASLYYIPHPVLAEITDKINELEAKTWPVAQ